MIAKAEKREMYPSCLLPIYFCLFFCLFFSLLPMYYTTGCELNGLDPLSSSLHVRSTSSLPLILLVLPVLCNWTAFQTPIGLLYTQISPQFQRLHNLSLFNWKSKHYD